MGKKYINRWDLILYLEQFTEILFDGKFETPIKSREGVGIGLPEKEESGYTGKRVPPSKL